MTGVKTVDDNFVTVASASHLWAPIPLLQAFDEPELLECIRRLVEVEQDWVPNSSVSDLYVRPAFIGTEVRPTCDILCSHY